MKNKLVQVMLVFLVIFFAASYAASHCEIPCGIYDDKARIKMIAEHITTIEKAMKKIVKLQNTEPLNCNQIIRWIMNKERHADEIQHIVSQYFMTQRIKPGEDKYKNKLFLLHKMLISAMKCKQTTNLSHPSELRLLLKEFRVFYFGPADKQLESPQEK
jgi:nickel superoxide dismutase